MKIKIKTLILLLLLYQAGAAFSYGQIPPKANASKSSQEIAKIALQSTVVIITEGSDGQPIGQGSGFIYAPGLVVSNLHVFERATNAYVKVVGSGKIFKATEVVAISAKNDICVIRIGNSTSPVLPLGESDKVEVGDEIYVASNPKGLEGSFTKGIVSSNRKEAGLFQIDAAISSGSSGGVLLNTKAEAVGIVTSSLVSGQNLNFAIPINKLKTLPRRFKYPAVLAGACAYSDADKEGLKGPVMKVDAVDDNASFEPRVTQNYDRQGNKIEEVAYSEAGIVKRRYSMVFDESSLIVEETTTLSDGWNKVSKFSFIEAVNNKLRERKFGLKVVHGVGWWSIYDDLGRETESKLSDFVFTNKYDNDGRVIERLHTKNSKFNYRGREVYDRLDDFGNWIEKRAFGSFSEGNWYNGGRTVRKITYY